MAIPAAAIPILIDVLNACMTVAAVIRDASGMDETSSATQIDWGQVVNGEGYYIYQNEYGTQSIKPVTYSLNTSINTNTYVIFGDEVYAFARKKETPVGTSSPNITRYLNGTQTAYLDWSGQSYFDTVLQIPGYESITKSNFIVRFLSSPPSVPASGNLAYKYIYGAAHTQGAEIYALTTDAHYGIDFTTMGGLAASTGAPYADVRGKTASYDDVNVYLLDWANTQVSEQGVTDDEGNQFYFTIDDMPSWEEASNGELDSETETETGNDGCGNTYIYVNADGSLTLNNDVSGDMPINIDNNADLNLSVSAAAGAFGAGAIVVDPDANVNLNAGAFAAGAFGAGAITGDISFSGDVTIDQSGSTITNNYYYDPLEPTESFTIDYDEILSEDELESILNQETYSLSLETVSFTDGYQIDVPELSSVPAEVVGTASSLIDYGVNVISNTGLMSIYAPLSIFSIICYILRGCK